MGIGLLIHHLGWDYSLPGGSGPTMWQGSWPGPTANPPQGAPGNPWQPQGISWWRDYSISAGEAGFDSVRLVLPYSFETPTAQSGEDIRECIVELLNDTSQVVPFFVWDKQAAGMGTWNDWDPAGVDGPTDGDWLIAHEDEGIVVGNIQDMSTWQSTINGTTHNIPNTPITPAQSERYIALGTGYHFYFGLVPGASSYDIFYKKYVPLEIDDEEVFVI